MDERLEILKDYMNYNGDSVERFRKVPLEVLVELVKKDYIDENGTQNDSPSTIEFMDFMRKWNKYNIKAHGYIVSKARKDSRITLEGLELDKSVEKYNDELFTNDWDNLGRDADDLKDNYMWWD